VYNCVQLELQKMDISSHSDTLALRKSQQIVLLFKGYENCVYNNLYVKNHLWQWPHVKVLVTCCANVFQHRGYSNCFLSDPSNPHLDSLLVHEVSSFVTKEVQEVCAKAYIPQNSTPAESLKTKVVLSAKQHAQHEELTTFLQTIHSNLVKEGLLKEDCVQNPQIYLSYTQEEGEAEFVIQQRVLKQIVSDLYSLGFSVWFDAKHNTVDNIANCGYALVIGTHLYCKAVEQESSSAQKEFDTILARGKDLSHSFSVILILFGECGQLPLAIDCLTDKLLLQDLDSFESYCRMMKSLVLQLVSVTDYQLYVDKLETQLCILPGKHLVVEHQASTWW
jgi:hypothetical protein